MSSTHEYFNRKHTEWSITGFLNESNEEPFRVKIGQYLKGLETIYDNEHGKRQEMARLLLDKYRKEPKPDHELARRWENERSHKQIHLHQPTINGTVSGPINGAYITVGTVGTVNGTGTISGKKRDQEDYYEELKEKRPRLDGENLQPIFNVQIPPPRVVTPPFPPRTPKHQTYPSDSFVSQTARNETKRNELNTDKRDPKNCTFDEYLDSECIDDDDVFEESQPINWEFDEPMPTWLSKVIDQQKFLTSQTDLPTRFKSSLNPIWWRIIDASDPNIVSDLLTEADMSELIAVFSSALNVGHPTEGWTILEPIAERCLQTLAKLDNDQLCKIGKIVQLEGTHGAILEIQKMVRNVETRSLDVFLFDEEDMNDKEKPELLVKEEDYLNPDVQYILDLVRFTCEMLAKNISKRKNSERDIDIFIERHIFSCLDNILDSHFGEMVSRAYRDRRAVVIDAPETTEGYHMDWMFTKHDLAKDLPYGREFSLGERTGSRIDNERKILSNTLKVQKTLRDMHRTLIEAISAEGGGMLSKQVLRATTKLLVPGFLSHCFFIRAFLVVYIGGGFYSSVNLADFDIPTTYSELGSVIRISRIMLQVKKLLNHTVCRFKLMKDRAEKEKFAGGRVIVNAEYRSPQKSKDSKQERPVGI